MKTTEIIKRIDFLRKFDFIQTVFESTRTCTVKGNMYFVKEEFVKKNCNEKWNLIIDTRHFECSELISEFRGTFYNTSTPTKSNIKIKNINKFIFWRKKTILDYYLIEGSKDILNDKLIIDFLTFFDREGININKIGANISFKLYLNTEYDDKFIKTLFELINQISHY